MRSLLLTTVAAAALALAGGAASAQSTDSGVKANAGTTTRTQSPAPAPAMKSGPSIKANPNTASDQADSDLRQKADQAQDKLQGKDDSATSASTDEKGATGDRATSKTNAQSDTNAAEMGKSGTPKSPKSAERGNGRNAQANVSLSSRQRTRIHSAIVKQKNAPRITKSEINFDIRVGVAVPTRVQMVALPARVVDIHPAWRGYLYFLVGDQIVIVTPGTHEIVAVIAA